MLTWRHSGDSKEGKTVLNINMTVSLLKITLIAICSANSYQLKSKRWMESRFFFHICSAFHNSNPKSFVKSIDCLKNSYNSYYFNISAFCLLPSALYQFNKYLLHMHWEFLRSQDSEWIASIPFFRSEIIFFCQSYISCQTFLFFLLSVTFFFFNWY